ncbi:MAG: transcriptional regulator [Planctomycetes bacterium]|nr:transcriptional regulator [Planctomycetota bacterium]MBL7038990.1 transcriptional regulator [Pirellulaceae bacterium]
MDEIIVRVARVLASYPRLRILEYLAQHGETQPTALAEKLHVPLNTISAHLRALTTAGLIQGRKSGPNCHYRLDSPYAGNTLSGKMSRWLLKVLGGPELREDHRGLPEVRDDPPPELRPQLHEAIFEIATAFTDLRRLQILRHLQTQGPATPNELASELSMSKDAVSRHTIKLRRRGLIAPRGRDGRSATYALCSDLKSPIHERMWEIVQATWVERSSRTSGSPR